MLRMEPAAHHGFAARRPAASSLPGTFNLPPLPSNPSQDTSTPRVSNTEGLSPLSTNVASSGNPQTTQGATLPNTYSYQAGNWPTPSSSSNSSSYVFSTSNNQEQTTPLSQASAYANSATSSATGRSHLYSPGTLGSYGQARQTPQSPASGNDNVQSLSSGPPPSTYATLPPYSSSAAQPGLPSHSHPQGHILSSQAPVTQPPPQSTTSPIGDSYSRAPAGSGYYAQTSTPQQQSFPSFASHPSHHAPHHPQTTSAMASRGLPSTMQGPQSPAALQPPHAYGPPRYTGYPPSVPPTIGGGVLSNIASPNNPMTLVNGGLMGHGIYGMYHHQVAPPTDRPFKCDQCPQSFNRNHDLKRHKRIHLAVKPFPCNHCDKSFSRKDALKRHKLVKGCGAKDDASNTAAAPASNDTNNVHNSVNDAANDDPNRVKLERDSTVLH